MAHDINSLIAIPQLININQLIEAMTAVYRSSSTFDVHTYRPEVPLTVLQSTKESSLCLTHNQACQNIREHTCLYSPSPPTYFKRSHSASPSRLQVMPLITSDAASRVFMCLDLQYVPGGLSRESEVQRPPARMINQS